MKQFSTYFWNGHHTFIVATSYEEALEKAKQMAVSMQTAVDYLLPVAN